MAVVTMRQLLESGVHFGHQTRRWNPKMKRFILTERNSIYIIDLQQSLSYIDRAYEFVKQTVAHGGTVMFIGTKKQAQEAIAEQATRVGMPYVNHRWLGGMLTNFSTVYKRIQRLRELEEVDFDDVASSGMTKKELLVMRREKEKLERTLGGIRDMSRVPSAVWIVDTKKEHIAVGEARKLRIPVVAILDTNCDPDEVDYKIPGNDDAIRSVALLTRVVADAVADGLMSRAGSKSGEGEQAGAVAVDEPLADWERDLLAVDDAKAADAVRRLRPLLRRPRLPRPRLRTGRAPAAECPGRRRVRRDRGSGRRRGARRSGRRCRGGSGRGRGRRRGPRGDPGRDPGPGRGRAGLSLSRSDWLISTASRGGDPARLAGSRSTPIH